MTYLFLLTHSTGWHSAICHLQQNNGSKSFLVGLMGAVARGLEKFHHQYQGFPNILCLLHCQSMSGPSGVSSETPLGATEGGATIEIIEDVPPSASLRKLGNLGERGNLAGKPLEGNRVMHISTVARKLSRDVVCHYCGSDMEMFVRDLETGMAWCPGYHLIVQMKGIILGQLRQKF